MKRAFSLFLTACILIVGIATFAGAVTPSGPGQTTAAHSMSVVFASDAPATLISTSGLATSAKQDTAQTSLSSLVTNTTSIATAARQDTGNTALSTIDADLVLLKQPTKTAAVTISDSTDLTATCTKGIWVGTGGDVAVKGSGDSSANTLKNVPSGTYVPGALSRVMSTNTTASNIVCYSGP
jgi:hypothetical protein